METKETAPFDSHVESSSRTSLDGFDEVAPDAIGGRSVAELPKKYFTSIKLIGSVVAFSLGYTSGSLAFIMVAGSLEFINAEIGPSPDTIWIILAMTLGQVTAFFTIGRLGDIFGRRWFFIGANTLAFVGYIVASRAQNIPTLIGGNIINGLGSGIQLSGAVVSGELVPNNRRFMSYAIVTCVFAPLTSVGPGIGKSFSRVICVNTEQGWRWIYYILAIISFLGALIQFFCYFPPKFDQLHKRGSRKETVKHLDYVGLVILVGSVTSLLLGISWGGQRYAWKSANVIATIVVGGVGFIILILWERFGKPRHPVLPLYLFANWNFDCLTALACVGSMIFYASSIVLPQQMAILYRQSPSATGWISCTTSAGLNVGFILAGALSHKIKHVKYQLLAGAIFLTTFSGAMSAADGTKLAVPIVFVIIAAIAIGWIEVLVGSAGPLCLNAKDIGVANGVQWGLRTLMSSLASSIYVTIFTNRVTTNIPKYVVPAALNADLPASSLPSFLQALTSGNQQALMSVPGVTLDIITKASAAAQTAYYKSFQTVYFASIAFGGAAVISALIMRGWVLDSTLTLEVARKLQKIEVHGGDKPAKDIADVEESGAGPDHVHV
ncbi:hypothetical protein AYO21_00815 [Fonsecaea monophora]|uniref:Major facilitator superfamily (MFS) profile domain-containing protein n=1 Tax=Fonsecaea monophora TaxID=254056 RepID=A0A177FKM1_9EURO|nr:hypothetical protein AYO21_00815 [Fonsecaea monophora]OAG44853.1 hypothetical protein AYO21_00815 [Fonsecaea monophora]